MRSTSPLILVAFILIALATGFVMFAPEPELVAVGSPDEMVVVSGYSRVDLPFTISIEGNASDSALHGSIYHLEPSGITLDRAATVRFMLTGLDNSTELVPYRFDEILQMWEAIGPITARADDYLEIETDRLGSFSLGLEPIVAGLSQVPAQLLTMAPSGTVGYEIATGYRAQESDPLLRLTAGTEIGGCGGVVGQGNREERSQVNLGNYIFLARWFVSDLHTCPQDRPLAAYPNVVE
jgi:hypothetical protein